MQERISFSFLNKLATYEVTSQSSHGDKHQQISYTTTIRKDDGWTHTYYEVSRSPQVVTPMLDNPYMEVLALSTTLWRDLKLSINNSGDILKIVNLEEIQRYWLDELKFKLTEMYVGEPVDIIISQLEEVVMDEQQFISKIHKDIFFSYWLKHNTGEYVQSYQTSEYTKLGRPNHRYTIEQTASKGQLIIGKGKKSIEELNKLKQMWKLTTSDDLDYKEDYSCEYSRDREIVKLVRKEVYTYQGSDYRTNQVEISKK